MTQTGKLRTLLRAPGMVTAPGAYDGLTAMLVAQAGFPAVYMTGAGTSVSHGYPDFGLLTETEMVANAALYSYKSFRRNYRFIHRRKSIGWG